MLDFQLDRSNKCCSSSNVNASPIAKPSYAPLNGYTNSKQVHFFPNDATLSSCWNMMLNTS